MKSVYRDTMGDCIKICMLLMNGFATVVHYDNNRVLRGSYPRESFMEFSNTEDVTYKDRFLTYLFTGITAGYWNVIRISLTHLLPHYLTFLRSYYNMLQHQHL